MQRSATVTWWVQGSIETTTSLSATMRSRAAGSEMSKDTARPRGWPFTRAFARSTLRAATATVCSDDSRM
jgi:hypothetical protein